MPSSPFFRLGALLARGLLGCPGPVGGADAGADAGNPAACSWGDDATVCGVGRFCDAPACGPGRCVALGATSAQTPEKAPVCGCDGLTYWNASVALSNGASVRATGACPTPISCGGLSASPCPGTAVCRMQLSNVSQCQQSDRSGECWLLPSDCGHATSVNTRRCGEATCTDECTLTSLHQAWYVDPSCP